MRRGDGGIGVIQSKVRAGNPNWDVVQVEAEELALGCYDGLYETIDWSRIADKSDFSAAGRERLRRRPP